MSKLYDLYTSLKNKDASKIYLIKSGIFYLALEDDALELSERFKFKLTNLNDKLVKCGFPASRIDYYSNLFNQLEINYEIIDSANATPVMPNANLSSDCNSIISTLASLDMNDISFKKAFEILNNLHERAKKIHTNN